MKAVAALLTGLAVLAAPSRAAAPAAPPAADPHAAHHAAPAPAPLPGGSLYQLGARLEASDGTRLELAALRGRPVVVTMFYSTCTSVCPMLTLAMQRALAALDPGEQAAVRFVMVSLDAERDDPARLAEFAQSHHLGAPFLVAHAGAADVRAIAAALGIRYRQLPDGSFSHASVLTLLDRDGVPLARTQVLAAADEAFIAKLRATLR
ncbi:MAG: SCO family protein [Proteobacteria bacterium]|nr:SCO family protein [Pseudomonadota bacterium]